MSLTEFLQDLHVVQAEFKIDEEIKSFVIHMNKIKTRRMSKNVELHAAARRARLGRRSPKISGEPVLTRGK